MELYCRSQGEMGGPFGPQGTYRGVVFFGACTLGGLQLATLHSCKYRWLRAPATKFFPFPRDFRSWRERLQDVSTNLRSRAPV